MKLYSVEKKNHKQKQCENSKIYCDDWLKTAQCCAINATVSCRSQHVLLHISNDLKKNYLYLLYIIITT